MRKILPILFAFLVGCSAASGQPRSQAALSGESGVMLLDSYPVSGTAGAWNVTQNAWIAERFQPTFAPDATAYSIAKARVRLKKSPTATGTWKVRVHDADAAGKPTGAALVEKSVAASSVATTFAWVDVTFDTPLTGLDPAKSYVLVVAQTAVTPTGSVEFRNGGSTDATCDMFTTGTAGASWSAQAGKEMYFEIHGTVTTP